ncbi:hypothetical protein PDIG_83210 [Penicillium digitatum PHI26]|uniref:Uncharacterized protein n=2 Tax=Penicillium digitatum TaxID=36651 RepID=K9F8M2_PEND2|nr:hypothetical protein PDIP_87000 [Penicillium digitatum Pd1]EKV04530.1 hypothetical protein PDIP_87000 [Penicillium digitatum Pd1]EKV05469.1 hypothetical protein PDIG_83210 [Penicillium digitatum PHI26]
MHLSTLLLLGASLASAQFGPSAEELEYFKPLNGNLNNDQNPNQAPRYNQNPNSQYSDNVDFDDDYDYQTPAPTPHTPAQAPVQVQTSWPSQTHSTFVVRPSQVPVAPSEAQIPAPEYGNDPSPAASMPFAMPVHDAPASHAPESASQDQSQNSPWQHAAPLGSEDEDDSAGTSGGIAPINLLGPDSQVAPPPLFTSPNHGKDEGNTFCAGKCFADESDTKCAKPYRQM